jgi:4-alpha-glucanotransferase
VTVAPPAAPQPPSPALVRLAEACGISTEYSSWNGQPRTCSAQAIRAAVKAMDLDASDDAACERSLLELAEYQWQRMVPPVTVLARGHGHELPVHIKHGDGVQVSLELESGRTQQLAQLDRVIEPHGEGSRAIGRATFLVPGDLPLGWHRIEAVASGRRGRGYVVVTPQQITVSPQVRARRPWGFATQLYSLRSSRSWGMGDYADLAELCALAQYRAGADFVLVNPLHAGEPVTPLEPSPYLPTSRRFLSPLYIRIEDIPEVAYVPSQQRAVIEWAAEAPRRANTTDELLDRDGVWNAKREALEQIYLAPRSEGREAQFEAFCVREGVTLEHFATWCALGEAHEGQPWPAEFANPTSRAVTAWRDANSQRVLFYAWLQWIADDQLGRAQVSAKAAGMSIGVMTDLAVGVHPEGADAWMWRRVMATGMSVGAPPDMYNQLGQDWSQPPWQPRALEAAAYLPFREVVRAALRHAGALRIDHVLGLFRQWWEPQGHLPDDGVYVQFDHDALVGILALEAERAGAIVIGEDLGTVEHWVTDYLNSRGVLGTSIVWFEKEGENLPKAPEHYRADALASVTTHDLPPSAAYLAGEHVDLREQLGLLSSDADVLRAEALAEREAMIRLLRERGWLREDYVDEDIVAAVHTLMMKTPALLTAIALTDAVGERKAQNQPGTHLEYPNWRVPLCDGNGVPVLLDDLFDHPRLVRLLAAVRAARA